MPLLLALAMCLSLVQVPAFAAEEEPPYEEAPACVCEAYCTEEAVNSSCPVCSENTGLCQGEVPESPEDEEVFPEHEHSFEVLEVISAPTCTEAGEQRLACSICGMETTEAIPAVGHREAVDAAVEPTETAPGLTEGTHCEVCETVLVKQEEIPAAGTVEPEIPAEVQAFLDAVDALYDLAEIDDAEAMLSAVNEAEELYDALTWEQTGLPEVRERREALDAFWDMVTLEEDVESKWIPVASETELKDQIQNSAAPVLLVLSATVETQSLITISAGQDVTLDLNGYELKYVGPDGTRGSGVLYVEGTLSLYDNSESKTGAITGGKRPGGTHSFGGGVWVHNGGTFNMYGGSICNNYAYNGAGGIAVTSADGKGKSTFNMYGGAIRDNTTSGLGGGVLIAGTADFNMYDGTISKNEGGQGGGVKVDILSAQKYTGPATFIMHGGSIEYNTDPGRGGGGVFVSHKQSTFEMRGGKISSNTTRTDGEYPWPWGGGVCNMEGATFKMYDGIIEDNTAGWGGGVFNSSNAFTMYGGTIKGNSANTYGGGIHSELPFTIEDGEISKNISNGSGGGVKLGLACILTINGGSITGNIAKESGGGIHVDGLKQSSPWGTAPAKLMMNNGTITGNIAAKGGGVCVESLQEFTRAENTKLCNNTASEAGDDIYNDDGILQLGSVGSDWTLDACEHPITGWYQDNKGQRWQGHAGEPYAVGYEGIGTGIKAAHGPYYGYTVNYHYGNMVEADHGSAALNEDIPYSSADNAIYNDRNYSLNHVEGGDKFVSAEASSNVVDVYYDLLYTVFWMKGYPDQDSVLKEMDFKDGEEPGEEDYPPPPASPDDYAFDGWNTSEPDEDGNITITAQWVKLHTVTYTDGVPGEEVFADQVFTRRPGEADPDFEGAPVRPGYRFVGWVRTEDGDGNIVYTAQWRRNTAPSGGGNAGGSTGGSTGGGTTTIPDTQTPLDPGTTIIDQEVPLAGAVGLNDADHFAYVIGYEDGTVRPLNNISRAEVATIFFRLMTDDYRQANWSTVNSFTDVKEGDWYNNAISTCARAGALKGRGDGSVFDPNANITRAEFAVIAARFLDSSYVDDGKGDFADTADHWAAKEIRLAAKAGWVNGNGNTFNPDAYITRAEVMAIVNRMLDRTPDKDHMLPDMKKWTDNPEDAWYYEAVQEATNEHDYTRDETAVESWTLVKEHRDWAALELGWAANGGAAAPQGETETQGLPDGI